MFVCLMKRRASERAPSIIDNDGDDQVLPPLIFTALILLLLLLFVLVVECYFKPITTAVDCTRLPALRIGYDAMRR